MRLGSQKGTALNPTRPSADLGYDLVLLLGQSNMSGRGTAYDLTRYDPPVERVHQFGATGTYASVISQAVEPLAMHDGAPSGIGPGGAFARWYLQSIPSNRRVLLVPAAHENTPLSSATSPLGWRRGVAGNLYAQALTQTQAALTAAGANSRVVAALWVQGESDGNNSTTGAAYATDLDALITGLRTDLAIPDLPFIVGQMLPEGLPSGTRNAINTVHLATPTRLARVGVSWAPFGAPQDGDHFNAAAQRIIGRRMFDAYLRVISGVVEPTPPAAPDQVTGLAASAITSTGYTVTWPAAARAGTYLLQWRQTGATPWQTLATTTGLTASLNGLTSGTSYDVRVTAIGTSGLGTPSAVLATTAGSGGGSDTQAPSTPTNLAATPGNAQVALAWTASTDNVGVTGYKVRRGGTVVGTPTGTSYTDTGLTNGTQQSYTVSAVDAAGNESAQTAAVTATPAAGSGTYTADSFTRADSTTTPGSTETGALAWQPAGGTWGISNNQLRCIARTSGGDSTQCVVDSGTADGTISAKMPAAGFWGLVFRASGDHTTTAYVLFAISGNYSVRKRTSQSGFSEIGATTGVTPTAGDTVSIVLSGSSITVKVNGTTRLTLTDASYSGTRHGLWVYGTDDKLFDDWSHTA